MNRCIYLVFAGADYYPRQAPKDLRGIRHTLAAAWSLAWSVRQEDWVRIIEVDLDTLAHTEIAPQDHAPHPEGG